MADGGKKVKLQYNHDVPHRLGGATVKDKKLPAITLQRGINEVDADLWAAVKDLPDVKHYLTAKEEDGFDAKNNPIKVPLIVVLEDKPVAEGGKKEEGKGADKGKGEGDKGGGDGGQKGDPDAGKKVPETGTKK